MRVSRREWTIRLLVSALSLEGVFFCFLKAYIHVGLESTFSLIIFNVIFISLISPLNGTFTLKTCIILLGNTIGLFWNYLFSMFAYLAVYYVGELFQTLYIIMNPLLSLIWIVSFWSISLTILTSSKHGE